MSFGEVSLVTAALGLLAAVRWFVRTANGAKAYRREPLPRCVDDYRGLAQPQP
jgi:hypothetical protein